VDDPVLGPLRFQRVGFWEGKRAFAPAGRDVEFTIDANAAGPRDDHREFFKEFGRRYPELWTQVEPMLRAELRNRSARVQPDAPKFDIESFGIPDPDVAPVSWEIVYTTASDTHYFCVLFEGWEPTGIRMDG
jgi:hypothetical protein